MSNLRHILKFGWPYIRRYQMRFIAGILLGLVFAASMGALLEVGHTVLKRLDRPTAAETAVEKPKAPALPHSSIAVVEWARSLEEKIRSAREGWTAHLDPWLPLRGRKLDNKQIIGLLLIFPLLMAFRGFTGYLSSYCLGWVSERVINDLQVDVLKKLHTLSLDYFNKSQLGDLNARVQTDTAWLHRTLSLGLSDLVKEPSTVLILFFMLLTVDWKMTLFAMIFLPVCILPITILGRKIRKAGDRSVQTKVSQSSLLLEILSGIRVVKAFGLEDQQARRFSDYARDLVRYGMKGIKAKELVNPIIETVTALILGILLVVMFQSGRDSDDVLALVIGLVAMYGPFKKIAGLHVLFEQSSAGVTRLAQILQERPTVQDPPRPKSFTSFQSSIQFENVFFRYADQPVLQGVTITVRRGERLGIAGESGCGKSTLLNLLPRFYDVTSGAVKIDGIDIRELSMHDLRQQMALVSQEIVIFDQTIAENIGCGRIGATRQEIENAAKAAQAHDFILEQPDGYDARPGERGIGLSVGQRQRLAIARAFVRDAPILILDEATASLDAKAEAEVQKAIDALAEHRTVICVAHRLSTLAKMDRIIVLDRGRIVEEGTFQDLLRRGGLFASMAARQGLQPTS